MSFEVVSHLMSRNPKPDGDKAGKRNLAAEWSSEQATAARVEDRKPEGTAPMVWESKIIFQNIYILLLCSSMKGEGSRRER